MHPINWLDPNEIYATLGIISIILGFLIWALRLTVKNMTIDLAASIRNLNDTVRTLNQNFSSTQRIQEQHYENHEGRIQEGEKKIVSLSATSNDHENRIKSNEDDIDKLKDKLSEKEEDHK